MRGRGVAAPAVQHHVEHGARRGHRHPAVRVRHGAGRQRRGVLGQYGAGAAEPLVQPVAQHRLRARQRLLGRLPHHDERAPPPVGQARQQLCRTGRRRQVQVVAARVHRAVPAGVRQPGVLPYGQGVQLRPQPDARAVAVAQDADHAVAAHPARDVAARRLQPYGEPFRRTGLLPGHLRVRVQVQVQREGRAQHLPGTGQEFSRGGRGAGGGGRAHRRTPGRGCGEGAGPTGRAAPRGTGTDGGTGRPVGTAVRDDRSGRRYGTAVRDHRSGRRGGRPVGTPRRDDRSGRRPTGRDDPAGRRDQTPPGATGTDAAPGSPRPPSGRAPGGRRAAGPCADGA
ncbi:hypothetical protein BG846_01349 [Streptomyces fradiae ATCC 10745 = DSM 40063]|uniref:Uncharacterized protein n=1 Tax=Streptomyces fradiae ATCC 10745 = DSM 40063 TaxID=1319510 RepID=A0A1Y2P167_STRFR|nr:hypothetical protein BG846_01349 [Streptomyces fradiae ATCC 10745 = DSM 40063]